VGVGGLEAYIKSVSCLLPYKMCANTLDLASLLKILKGPGENPDPATLLRRFSEYDQARLRFNIQFLRVWAVASLLAITTALVGSGSSFGA